VVSSYAEPLQAPPPPSTNYGSPSYGLPPQTPYPLLNPYDPYAAPLPPPRRHVKLGMLIGIVVLVLVFVSGGVFAFLIQGTKRDTQRQTPMPTTIPADITATAEATASTNPYSHYGGTLALNDQLRDNSKGYGWEEYVTNSSGAACQFMSDGYHVSERQNFFHPCHPSLQFNNVTFEVQMKIITETCGGVVLRDTTTVAHSYAFEVCQDGSSSLYRFDGFSSSPKTLISQSSSAIHTGLNQTNLIAAIVKGCNIDLYVNKQHVNSASDCTYNRGQIGVVADASTEAVYSNAKVWTL